MRPGKKEKNQLPSGVKVWHLAGGPVHCTQNYNSKVFPLTSKYYYQQLLPILLRLLKHYFEAKKLNSQTHTHTHTCVPKSDARLRGQSLAMSLRNPSSWVGERLWRTSLSPRSVAIVLLSGRLRRWPRSRLMLAADSGGLSRSC